MRSISPTSGSGGGVSARCSRGIISPSDCDTGTSHAGNRWHRRPDSESSKMKSVDCVLFIFDETWVTTFRYRTRMLRKWACMVGDPVGMLGTHFQVER